MARNIVVVCPRCGYEARVLTNKKISLRLKQLYCSCNNHKCGHGFVMELVYSHTTTPSALDLPETLREQLRNTTPAMQGSLFG